MKQLIAHANDWQVLVYLFCTGSIVYNEMIDYKLIIMGTREGEIGHHGSTIKN